MSFAIRANSPRRLPHPKPIALLVLLENVGHVAGLKLPGFVRSAIDFVTEEYAKYLLRHFGAYRQYDAVTILEDERATGASLAEAVLRLSPRYQIDLLLLVHGKDGQLVGYKGVEMIGPDTFELLLAQRMQNPDAVNLRMVFGLNCYGATLAQIWRELGATVVNGSPGVNWLPEPSLSVFLRNWLQGQSYSVAVQRSNTLARIWGGRIWRAPHPTREHRVIESSRQIIYGEKDISIHSQRSTYIA